MSGESQLERTRSVQPVGLPGSGELLASFDTDERAETLVVEIAQRLRRHHDAQWEAEDRSRTSAGDDRVLAALKRQIDEMNMARSRLVDEIDMWATEHVPQYSTAALHTETLGSVIDRLCIASIRADRLGRTPNAESRALLADHQLRQLSEAYDQLVEELLAGRRRVPGWRMLKSYGESARQ